MLNDVVFLINSSNRVIFVIKPRKFKLLITIIKFIKSMKSKISFFSGVLMLLLMSSCQKDNKDDFDSPFAMSRIGNDGLKMEYDFRTTRFVRPLNPSDNELLTKAEKSLLVPEVTDMKVFFEIDTEGNYFCNIDILPSQVNYPADMIGRAYVTTNEGIGRIEFTNAGAKYFDKSGQLLNSFTPESSDVIYYKNMAQQLAEKVILPQQQFVSLMQAWEEAGYEVKQYGENKYSIKFDLSGGRVTYVYVDKVNQSIIGTSNHESDGSVVNRTHNITSGDPSNPESITTIFATPFKGPLSDIDMQIVISAKATNIVKTLNI